MKGIFHRETFSDIQMEDSKLRTYSLLKITQGYEKYLSEIRIIETAHCTNKTEAVKSSTDDRKRKTF